MSPGVGGGPGDPEEEPAAEGQLGDQQATPAHPGDGLHHQHDATGHTAPLPQPGMCVYAH